MFDDFGRVAMGRLGQWLVYLTVYLTVFTEPIVFHLTRRGQALLLGSRQCWPADPLPWHFQLVGSDEPCGLGRLMSLSSVRQLIRAHVARSMESLQQVFYQKGLGQRLAALIVTAIMVPLSQVRLPRSGAHICGLPAGC